MIVLKKILLFAFFALFTTYNPGANEKPGILPDKLVPVNVRLTNLNSTGSEFEGCESTIHSFLNKWTIEGASVAIAKDGKLMYAKGIGYADTTLKDEVQPYNKFRIASVSKLVTAVAIMKLQEEGKLSVNDKVFGPDGILNDTCYCHPKDKRVFDITIAHLLSHEGGWTQKWGDQMFMPLEIARQMNVNPPIDLHTILRFVLSKKLHFTPGTCKSYSNLGYSILGLVVEKASGVSYDEYCHKHIFEPLGIYDMMLAKNLPSQKAPFEVTYYEPAGHDLKPSIYGTGELVPSCYGGNDIETLGSAGSWLATAPDLMRLLLAIDGFNSKKDFLTPESIHFMTDPNNRYAPVGWKSIIINGTWYRTGSFSGTLAMMKRQSDGISWVMLLNSSSWKGPALYSYVDKMMTRAISQINEWPDPEYNLFNYSLPLPVKIGLSGIN